MYLLLCSFDCNENFKPNPSMPDFVLVVTLCEILPCGGRHVQVNDSTNLTNILCPLGRADKFKGHGCRRCIARLGFKYLMTK